MKPKAAFRKFLHLLGYDIRRLTPAMNSTLQLRKALEHFAVDVVLDVGANKGQFASELRSVGYKGTIVSFEPLSAAYGELLAASNRDARWTVHPRTAIGDSDGELVINVAGNSVSSSVLPMLEAHAEAAPDSGYVAKEKAPVARLDSIAGEYLSESRAPFLKLDTQGYEWTVLNGAVQTLPKLKGVLCELSIVPLYEGQHLWLEVAARLEEEGFTLWALQRGFSDARNGRTLQLDAVFFRV